MMYVNGLSFMCSVAAMIYFGGFVADIGFCQRHPRLVLDVVALSVSSTLGQVFILETIYYFGALSFAAVMNFRQLGSVLLSIAVYGHAVNALQWTGVALCFGGLFVKAYLGYRDSESRHEAEQAENEASGNASRKASGASASQPRRFRRKHLRNATVAS